MSWLDVHRETLRELFTELGAAEHWTHDSERLVRWMEINWLGAEHGRQVDKPTFPPEAVSAARPLLAKLGLTTRVEPPDDEYDEILVLGAAGGGLHRRMELVRSSGVRAAGLSVLAGLRPHERQDRDGGLDELLAPDGRFAPAPGWTVPSLPALLQRLLAAEDVDQHVAAAVVFPSETDLAELLLVKQWPSAEVTSTVHAPPHPVENELGQRPWAVRTWSGGDRIPTLRVVNGAPVARPPAADGKPRPARPTTMSTFDEWVELVAAGAPPLRLLALVNQPHLHRVRMQLLKRARALGLDLRIDVAGCETLPNVDVVLCLGEIPASIRVEAMVAGS